ncbi:MAG: O-antigen ligase family protein [Rhizobiaceae bacterium]|nr:O-antigen ligase family protein [Rhizobiaceae bacterium]
MPTNNTASLKRTEPAWLARVVGSTHAPTAIAAILLTIVFISFRPFQPQGAGLDPDAGGDIVNQLGFSMVGGLALFSLVTYANPRVVSIFFSPWWLAMLGCFAFSITHALDPSATARAGLFTLIGLVTVVAILSLPRDADAFSTVLGVSGAAVVGLSYIGLVLLPGAAMHNAAEVESEFAGLWRGVFAHKNIAGPVMAGFSFVGIYLFRRGWKLRGLALLAAAMFFMANTGSKTTAGLVPLSILIVMVPGLLGMRGLTVFLVAAIMIGTALATVGMVFIEPVKHLMLSLFPDLTYTGRTSIWEFAGEMIARRPWTGYGFDSFWGKISLATTDHPIDRAWDVRRSVHGHDGYIDIALSMGLPALGVAIITFLIVPMRDYLRIPLKKENVLLGDFFMMTFMFTALNAFLESFFFRRVDPVWLFFVISVLGLRMVARRIIPAHPA